MSGVAGARYQDGAGHGGGSGVVKSVTGSAQIHVDNTDPANPVIHTHNQTLGSDNTLVEQLQAGTNVTIDNTNPLKPVVNATGGSGGGGVYTENIQIGAYTFVLTDALNGLVVVVLNSAAAASFTIPRITSVAWPTGSVINLLSINSGLLTIIPGAGVAAIQSPYGKVQLATQYARATLINRAADVWSLEGDLA